MSVYRLRIKGFFYCNSKRAPLIPYGNTVFIPAIDAMRNFRVKYYYREHLMLILD